MKRHTDLVLLLRILANPPRHHDAKATKEMHAIYRAEALALASEIEAARAQAAKIRGA